MASQTGSIDLTASNSVKLAAEAGWQSDLDSYYTKSEIDVTVSGINSTVSTKVGEDEVISSINQSSESVSINASKINLTGAVTISDLASDANNALTDAAKTATNYIRADATGIRIASTDPSESTTTTYQHQTSTKTEFVVNSAVRTIIDSDSVRYFDGNGVADGNVTASFGTGGAQIGRSSDSHLSVTNSGMSLSRPLLDSGFDVGLGPRTAEQNESSSEPITEVPVVHELEWTPQQDSIRVLKDNLDRTFTPPSGERTYAYTLDGKEVTLTDARLVGYRYLIDYTATDFSDVSLTVGSRDSGSIGRASTAFGYMLIAAGEYSHAEGNRSKAEGTSAHAEGLRTKAFDSAHAEGAATTASGYASHAEGVSTTASGYASHAEGNYSEADGLYSHAEGRYTKASGYYAHAQNQGTLASAHNQTAIGRYNIAGPGALIIGNGTDDDNRSNAFVVGWDGSLEAGGTVLVPESGKVGLTSDVPAGGTVDVSISFAKEHGAAPNVIVGLYSTSTAGAIGQVSAAVTSVTTTGFVARLFNAGTSARRPGLYWMTLG